MNDVYTDLEGGPWRWGDERKGVPHEDFYQPRHIQQEYSALAQKPHMYPLAVQGKWYFLSRLSVTKDSPMERVELLRTESKSLDQLIRLEPQIKEQWEEEMEID